MTAALLLVLSAVVAEAPPVLYRMDVSHSRVAFSIPFLHSRVNGTFDAMQGTLTYDAGAPELSSVTIVLQTGSIHTGSKHRDEHLRSSDFFDVARHATAVFRSTRVAGTRDRLVVTGQLTIRGITREVEFPVQVVSTPDATPQGTTLVHFAASFKVARRDFEILGGSTHNSWFDAIRSATMGDTALVEIEFAGWTPDYAPGRDPSLDSQIARVDQAGGVAALLERARSLAREQPQRLESQQWALEQLGRAFLFRGRHADALATFRLAIELFPEAAVARTALGEALLTLGRTEEAEREIGAALALDSTDTRAMELLRRFDRRTSRARR